MIDSSKLAEIFNDALDLDQGEREQFLSHACNGDQELRSQVDVLLSSYISDQHFLESRPTAVSAAKFADEVLEFEDLSSRGKLVGDYKIKREIARGGTSSVFLATNVNDAGNCPVAVKLLRPLWVTDSLTHRFESEKLILADLQHPGIAKLLASGVTERDIPYFVMEYVDGYIITDYCSRKDLDLRARLRLFSKVCDAVDYAHSKGIIHRDLKPNNIMVTKTGEVRLLDFGIAKSFDRNSRTKDTAYLMTPEYASPEQVRGEKADRRADIYSLGVVLYEMLTGRRTFDAREYSPYGLINAICENVPSAPSAVTDSSHPYSIPRDVDNIVLLALRKDPSRRYQTVADLSDDIQRYLNDEPIRAARHDGIAHQIANYAKRGWSTAVAIIGIVAIVFLTLFVLQKPASETVAIMPFISASSDPQLNILADHLRDEVIERITGLDDVDVRDKRIVDDFFSKGWTPYQLVNEVGVDTVLVGDISAYNDEVGINLSLVNGRSNQRLWSEIYVGRKSELEDLKRGIVEDVALRLRADQPTGLTQFSTGNEKLTPYRLYLKGREYWYKRTPDDFRNSLTLLNEAVDKDSGFALAYTGIADNYILLALHGAISKDEGFTKAKQAAELALNLDPNLSEAHASVGAINWLYLWDWIKADESFRLSVKLNPNNAAAHHWYGLYLAEMGRFGEALDIERRAVALDPLSVIINSDLGRVMYYMRSYDDSLAQFEKAASLDTATGALSFDVTFVYEQLGMETEWFSVMERFNSISSHELRTAFGDGGIKGFYRKRTELNENERKKGQYFGQAEDYARIGEKDKAVNMLEKAYKAREHAIAQLKANPVLDPLRDHPRFVALLKTLRLE